MNFVASPRTAAIAGVWTGLGMSAFDLWHKHWTPDISIHIVGFMTFLLVFIFVPGMLFVSGTDIGRFGIRDILRREFWTAHGAHVYRGFCWGLVALGTNMINSALENLFAI